MLEELKPNLYEDQTYERLVDFGHTFSPGFESTSGYTMHHGEAVAIDMALSAAIAAESGLLPVTSLERIVAALAKIGLPTWTPLLTIERCERSLAEAAHHRGGSVNLVVPTAIGHATFLRGRAQIPRSLLRRAISSLGDMERGATKRVAGSSLRWSHQERTGL
jgi:3-dehydroquinate synthase